MSLLGKIGKFARSPQGKKLMHKAEEIAKDPKTKAKIEEARERFEHKDKPASQPASTTPPASPQATPPDAPRP